MLGRKINTIFIIWSIDDILYITIKLQINPCKLKRDWMLMFIWWFKKRASFYCTIHIRGNPVLYFVWKQWERSLPRPEMQWVSCKTLDLCYRFLKQYIFFSLILFNFVLSLLLLLISLLLNVFWQRRKFTTVNSSCVARQAPRWSGWHCWQRRRWWLSAGLRTPTTKGSCGQCWSLVPTPGSTTVTRWVLWF